MIAGEHVDARQATDQPAEQRFGPLVINRAARMVSVDGRPINLTKVEYALLDELTQAPRRAFSSEHLMRVISGSDWVRETHAIQVYVSRLRAKLGESGSQPRRVITVHGFGYRFEPAETDGPSQATATDDGQRPQVPVDEVLVHLLVSLDRTVLWISSHITLLLGWDTSQVQDTFVYDLFHPGERRAALQLRKDLDTGNVAAFRGRMRTADNGYRLIDGFVRPILGRSGTPEMFLGQWQRAGMGDPRELVNVGPIDCQVDAQQRPN